MVDLATLQNAAHIVRQQRGLLAFTKAQTPSYRAGWVHAEIAAIFEDFSRRVARGESPREIVTAPPRHGKSREVSECGSVWHLGHYPWHEIVCAGYALGPAQDRTRLARELALSPEARAVFPTLSLSRDTASKTDWRLLVNGRTAGGMYAVGVRGSLTSRGAHILMVDDPLKDWEDAQSPAQRQKTWEWYTSTAVTRLAPGGGIFIVQCMTGDTPVLLADGTETRLDMLRPGDAVATHDNGELSASRVVNWKSCGRDFIYTITTTSGRVVRANGRHPFLVSTEGGQRWIRTDQLTTACTIVALRGSGENGRTCCVPQKDATCRPSAEDFATRTTTRKSGLTDQGHRPSIKSLADAHTSSTATASVLSSTTRCCETRAECVQSASSRPTREPQITGGVNSASTTAMKREPLGDCCVTTATPPLATLEVSRLQWQPQSTSSFILDRVLSVEPAGQDEVFDVQIERTENFIANGLVSHNTRWHEDDLTGRVLDQLAHEGWRITNFRAIAEVDEYSQIDGRLLRRAGEALHPARRPLPALEQIRATLGPTQFSALFQQRPVTPGGEIWRRDWFRHYATLPDRFDEVVLSADFSAGSTSNDASFPVIQAWGKKGPDLYLLEEFRRRCDYPAQRAALVAMVGHHQPRKVLVEDAAHGKALIQELRPTIPQITPVPAVGSKISRAHAAAASIEQGRVWLPMPDREPWVRDWLTEVTTFPAAANDDRVDAAGQAIRTVLHNPRGSGFGSVA